MNKNKKRKQDSFNINIDLKPDKRWSHNTKMNVFRVAMATV